MGLKNKNADGEIAFSFEEDNSQKRLLIKDSGIGIKPEDIQRVFNKGFTGQQEESMLNPQGWDFTLQKSWPTIHFPKIRQYYEL